MTEIIVNNSYSQVKGLTNEALAKLRKVLSYEISESQAYFSGSFRSRTRSLIDRRGFFPTGLLRRAVLALNGTPVKYDDKRVMPPLNAVRLAKFEHVPYPDQEQAAKIAINLTGGGTISMPTGTGKSVVIALLIRNLNLRTLVIVPTLELKTQLQETLRGIFGSLKNITVENIDSGSLKTHTEYDVLIIDEAHHVAAKTYRNLNKTAWKGIYYRFFLTATPFRSRDEEQLLFESIAGDVVFSLTYQDAIKKGYIVPVEAYYYDLPKRGVSGDTWASVYSELVVNNEYRNDLIKQAMINLGASGAKALVLVKEIKHGKNLIGDMSWPFANGQDETSKVLIKHFNAGNCSVLIGTTGILGEGVDTKPAEYVIIAGLGKAKGAFMQQVGRGVRKYGDKVSCKVILFRDPSNKWTLKHFKEQCKILRDEYGVIPVKLEA